jgi:hypothetical protein
MRVRRMLLLVSAATVGTMLFAAQAASGQTVIHVVVQESSFALKVVDLGHDGLRLGDRLAGRATMLDETASHEVGTAYVECVVHKRITDGTTGLWNCTYILDFEDGQITLKGLDPRGPGSAEFAVLGGTGAYSAASGDATFTDTEGQTDMMIRLSD